ncbi:MAG: NAD(P)/FAD-dependent oxidoreductase [Oscillatoriales cyanobacterium]|uniref:NAD(P)/FAD-dependent oxidoreductase n=1 Tax=Microcoleus anatoxicus TaxID=2705319 RepID=UPI002979195B|nr:MAG: NAD(P)/FAD-dependent oxidoreductase [Oscillatoriales cyanobacterium]TAE06761.1 MAG: NAD(P)/FAD-dependent oxidoreductase [Oscillatoriales cyanobacterium]TAF05682.1 MAG: NAD(P)/FAD-dependent oxidoreductase [Oscillatoriales cyanobacterium]TAF65049.1 MAG: NAD(P)/FAD-dependent oxidoreductase [Oscillatoriales cyanobacterium]
MTLQSFDIVIVGAGPAGGHCARILAKSGRQVLLAEQNDNFNKNDFSSAATPLETLSKFDLPESVIGSYWQKITIQTSKVSQTWESPKSLGVVLNFAKFRAFLASEVQGNGSELWLGYRYIKHSQVNGETIVEFKQLSDGKIIQVSAKILVDATGFARAIMYEKENDKPDFLSGTGIEYLIEVEPEVYDKYANDLIFFLGDKWMPKGYSWIFPMEQNRLKVGAGRVFLDPKTVKNLEPMKKYIYLLIHEYLKSKNYQIIDKHGSTLKYSQGLKDIYYQDNIIAIGDAVSTVNFLGGEGIRHGMDGAEIAGKYIEKYLDGKISSFGDYEREMHRKFDKKWHISERLAVRKYIDDVNDVLTDKIISYLKYMKTEEVMNILFDYKFEIIYRGFGGYFKMKIKAFIEKFRG